MGKQYINVLVVPLNDPEKKFSDVKVSSIERNQWHIEG